ncbi:MAG: metallophosphoesterase [Planctomycetota bacterium]|nr:metallophosphoesterase [Planctomycetota bacterium]
MRIVVFFSIVVLVAVGLHAYIGVRLIGSSPLSPTGRRRAWAVLAAMALLMLVAFIGGRVIERAPWFQALQWIGFTAMGLILVLFPLLLFRDVLWGAGLLLGAKGDVDLERRDFLRQSSAMAVLGTGALISIAGLVQARRRAAVVEVDVPLRDLPDELEGFRIVQITDVHVGPTIGKSFLRAVVDDVLALEPDLVAFTGDLADGYVDELREAVAPLADLDAKHGVYFVTGNHEYYWDPAAWIGEVRRLGLTVLNNEHRLVEVGGARLLVAGVTDYGSEAFVSEHRSDPAAAIDGAPRSDVKLLLAHQPKSLHAARAAGFDLQLSGHTHGGQFFPWNLLIGLAQPIVAGLERFDRLWVYVSRGTGYWGPPMRSPRRSEITVVKLTRAR